MGVCKSKGYEYSNSNNEKRKQRNRYLNTAKFKINEYCGNVEKSWFNISVTIFQMEKTGSNLVRLKTHRT